MGQFQVPKIQNSRIPALSKVHNQEMIGERLVLYCPTKLDRYDLADPSLSPRRSTDSSALLEREGAGCAVAGENGGTRFLEPAASSVGSSGILVCKLKPQLRKKVKTQNTEVP